MVTAVRTDTWTPLAEALADEITKRGALRSPVWRAALTAVPRHELVPRFFRQNSDATWAEVTSADPDYLTGVYSNKPLITSLTQDDSGPEPASSSSQPSLMIRMLEALDLHDNDRVLEIGTGTGYNAGLLSHRLGQRNVYSVDIDGELVEQARHHLEALGLRPALAAVNGAHGWPEHGPYGKIIATCSVASVPWTWAEQTSIGGKILVDVKIGQSAGNLVLLDHHENRVEGRFLPGWAGFMGLRNTTVQPPRQRRGPTGGVRLTRTTTVEPPPWSNLVRWFMAMFYLPAGLGYGVTLDPDTRQPVASFLTAPDGSSCEIGHHRDGDGYPLTETGATSLWPHVENADRFWRDTGEPGWERLGLTATATEQHVWLDNPDGPHHWPLGH